MKKLFLLAFIGVVLTATVFGQVLDFPSWLREGMTINEIRNELKGVSIVGKGIPYLSTRKERNILEEYLSEKKLPEKESDNKEEEYPRYEYTQNGFTHTFHLMPDWGLLEYTVEGKNVDIYKLISYISKKYNLPQPEKDKNYIRYNWDLKKISTQNKSSLYTVRHIDFIQISQKKDSSISLNVTFINNSKYEEERNKRWEEYDDWDWDDF